MRHPSCDGLHEAGLNSRPPLLPTGLIEVSHEVPDDSHGDCERTALPVGELEGVGLFPDLLKGEGFGAICPVADLSDLGGAW